MGAGASKSKDENIVLFLVNEEPIGSNMTLVVARPFAGKSMIVIFGGKRLVVRENFYNFEQFRQFKMTLLNGFIIFFEASRE